MPEQAAPGRTTPSGASRAVRAHRRWHKSRRQSAAGSLMADLVERGYLDRAARRPCVDDHRAANLTQYELLGAEFSQRLGSGHGPLDRSPEAWPDAHFFAMVEVSHELVARPRRRRWHDYDHSAGTTAISRSTPPEFSTGGASTGCWSGTASTSSWRGPARTSGGWSAARPTGGRIVSRPPCPGQDATATRFVMRSHSPVREERE